jgi:isopenicillin N synthase-like dioxygenase
MHSLKHITSTCTDIAQVIFRMLSAAFLLLRDKSFESLHQASHASPDIVRLLKYAANTVDNAFTAPQAAHTDIGSLTFLFSDSPGLQILPAGSTEWLYVLPKARQPIVNFGDAMSIFTNGMIRSVYHRVASLPGKGMEERYSFAFLMRPDASALMCPLPSPAIKSQESSESALTSEERIAAKFGVLRGSLKS